MRAALVLAAGLSRRFGRADKLRVLIGGRPLLLHALDRAREAVPAGRVLLVVPSAGGALARLARARGRSGLRLVVARAHRQGMGASLAAGLRALRPIEREVLIFLGDMPAARARATLRLGPLIDAARPMRNGTPGHPLLVRTAAARAANGAAGGRGLAAGLDRERVRLVRGAAGNTLDIDTRAALAHARRRGGEGAACRTSRAGSRPQRR